MRPDALVAVSGLLSAGSVVMAVAHMGLAIPAVSALGPGGSRPVVPAAIAFTVLALLHGLVAVGVASRRGWAWPVGIGVAAVTALGAAFPFRGAVSAIGVVLAIVQLALLTGTRDRRGTVRRTA